MLQNTKTKKVEKVMTTLKDRIGHPLKRHLTEILTRVNNLKSHTDGVIKFLQGLVILGKFIPDMRCVGMCNCMENT